VEDTMMEDLTQSTKIEEEPEAQMEWEAPISKLPNYKEEPKGQISLRE